MTASGFLGIFLFTASLKMVSGAESPSIDTGDLEFPQLLQSLPGQLVGPLPGQMVKPLSGQLIPFLPGQVIQSLPGQVTPSLPGQVVPPLPGQVKHHKLPWTINLSKPETVRGRVHS